MVNNTHEDAQRLSEKYHQTFFDHIDELRSRLFQSVIFYIVACCITYAFIDNILAFILKPIGEVVFVAPADAFLAEIMLCLLTGFFLSSPFLLFQFWKFVETALKDNERSSIIIFAPISFILFLIGGLFAYIIVMPITIKFLLGFGNDMIRPMITIKNYVSFLGTMILAFGVTFELPLVLLFLTRIGIATPSFLEQKRRHAIIIMLIVSAFITPPDLITQLILAAPLMILYEIGIITSKVTYKKYKSKEGSS